MFVKWDKDLHKSQDFFPESRLDVTVVIVLPHVSYLHLHVPFIRITYDPPHDKPTKCHVRPAKAQISLGIRPV